MAGRIASQDIADLRDRTSLVEVVSSHTQLKKTGRIFKGLCCFHQEKTPSMVVDPEKQLYYCHGCGAGGDVFTFLQKVEGLDFTESAQRLADKLGVQLRIQASTAPQAGARSPLLAATAAAGEYFASMLAKSAEAAPARKHLEARGFSAADATEWKIGFSPRGADALYRELLRRKFSSRQIIDAGLALLTESGQHRDRFRGRLMFPISDLSGNVVGFGGRAIGDEQPKYINSPETAIYHKAKILFGLDRAKNEMVRSGTAIVTEGYTDVIALNKAGFANAVATCGTALGEDHFTLIKRFCDRVILAFDADAAGAIASERGFGIHARAGLEVLVALMPAGKDPADVAIAGGREAFYEVIDQATSLMRFVLEQEIARHRLDTAEGKARAVRAAVARLAWEPNRVARSEHGFWVARRIGVAPEQVQQEIAELGQAGAHQASAEKYVRRPGHVKAEREALRILLDPESQILDLGFGGAVRLNEDHFTQPNHRVVFTAIKEVREVRRAALAYSQNAAKTSRDAERGAVWEAGLQDGGGVGQTPGAAESTPSRGEGGAPPTVMDLLPDDETRRLAAELAVSPETNKDPEEIFTRLELFHVERQIAAARAKLDRLDPKVDATEYDSMFEQLMRLDSVRRSLGVSEGG